MAAKELGYTEIAKHLADHGADTTQKPKNPNQNSQYFW